MAEQVGQRNSLQQSNGDIWRSLSELGGMGRKRPNFVRDEGAGGFELGGVGGLENGRCSERLLLVAAYLSAACDKQCGTLGSAMPNGFGERISRVTICDKSQFRNEFIRVETTMYCVLCPQIVRFLNVRTGSTPLASSPCDSL